MVEVEKDVRRITFPMPFGLDHVHCYLLRAPDGTWTLVDTGLGSRDPEAKWRPVLDELDAPIGRVVITHMHPDHVGGSRDIAELVDAPVLQGAEDYDQCVRAWGQRDPERWMAYWRGHGMPQSYVDGIAAESEALVSAVHWVEGPQLLAPGDEVHGWRVEVLRGHADGHIVLIRGDVMIAGDVILGGITPAIGLYPNSRPDPLGDYFETLERFQALDVRVAYTGHKDPVEDPAARARTIRAHHLDRLDRTVAALGGEPRSPYDVSLDLFADDLTPTLRRFATAEALAHLERLVAEGRAQRADGGYAR